MNKIKYIIPFLLLLAFYSNGQDRFDEISKRLNELSQDASPGLKEPVNFSVSGVSIQEFLRGIAETNNLNISIDPSLDIKIVNNFNNEKVTNVILFLCKEFDLDISFVGSIMSFKKYIAPIEIIEPPKPKEIVVGYNKEKDQLSLDLEGDELGKVVKKITQISGKNVIIPSGIRTKKVDGFIQGLDFESALKKFSFANDLDYEATKDGAYYLTEKEKVEVNNGSRIRNNGRNNSRNGNSNGQFNLDDVDYEITYDDDGNEVITISATDIPVVDAIKLVSEEMGISYMLYSEPEGTTTLNLTKMNYSDFLSFILQGTEHTYRADSNAVYMIGERALEGLRATRVVQLEYRSVDEMVNMIPAELRKGVEISEFREQNSIVLSGGDPQIQEIINFLADVDKVVPMVMIEVIIVDIRKTKSFQAGLRAGIAGPNDSAAVGGSILGPGGVNFNYSTGSINKLLDKLTAGTSINLGKVPPNFYLNLRALDSKNYANVRQMPKLATLNGHEANMSIGRSSYYSVETQNFIGTQNPVLNSTLQWNEVQANLAININPVVSGDNQVTLEIDVELSDFLGVPPDNAPPPSATSQFTSLIRVRNEDMIVLGGLERIEKSEGGSGVPILSHIPVIKWLFSYREKSKSKTLTNIFIKPTIIY